METAENRRSLEQWVTFLSQVELPVLAATDGLLAELRHQGDRLSARDVARAVLTDPIMTAKLLRFLQGRRAVSQAEIIQVEQALMMLGLLTFFRQVSARPAVESLLAESPEALDNLLRVLSRAHRAANYAREWAVRLNDRHYDEVYVAALLHDLAEMLLWCFSPTDMLTIRQLQGQDKALRSRAVQEQVLGFPISELQRSLTFSWGLPQLLMTLMDDAQARHPRVLNVSLAINLARHSANGWEDAALPDDYTSIGQLLRISGHQAMQLVKSTSLA